MSLKPESIGPVPEETVRVARAAFPNGNLYMRMRDELGSIFEDQAFASLFSTRGQPAEAPWRLALATIMQYVEGLPDRDAADAVRGRIDWKYALGLELEDPGFDHTVLSEFRTRLVSGDVEQLILDRLLEVCKERKWLKAGGRQRTDSTQVLAVIRAVNRLGCVRETMRHALDNLAHLAPEWLKANSPPVWVERYKLRDRNWGRNPKKEDELALATAIGVDGHALLAWIYDDDAQPWLRQLPAVETLRQVWVQQYCVEDDVVRYRSKADGLPPARTCINSPHDLGARLASKNTTHWVGYKAHLTESCEDGSPRLITHVETTAGPVSDGSVTPDIHSALEGKGLLPSRHIVDTGYLDAELLVNTKRDYGVDLVGPTRRNYHWQARAGMGFDAASFTVDWDRKKLTCPEGHKSESWSPVVDNRHNDVIKIKFSIKDCRSCPSHARCTQGSRRGVTLRPQAQYTALREARDREESASYAEEYRKRAGIEGTISQAVRSTGIRRSRYVGLSKTHLKNVLSATAINFERIANWLAELPLAGTRQSRFVRLMSSPAPA